MLSQDTLQLITISEKPIETIQQKMEGWVIITEPIFIDKLSVIKILLDQTKQIYVFGLEYEE